MAISKGFKAQLKELDRLIAAYKNIAAQYPKFSMEFVAKLEQERAELVSKVGRKP